MGDEEETELINLNFKKELSEKIDQLNEKLQITLKKCNELYFRDRPFSTIENFESDFEIFDKESNEIEKKRNYICLNLSEIDNMKEEVIILEMNYKTELLKEIRSIKANIDSENIKISEEDKNRVYSAMELAEEGLTRLSNESSETIKKLEDKIENDLILLKSNEEKRREDMLKCSKDKTKEILKAAEKKREEKMEEIKKINEEEIEKINGKNSELIKKEVAKNNDLENKQNEDFRLFSEEMDHKRVNEISNVSQLFLTESKRYNDLLNEKQKQMKKLIEDTKFLEIESKNIETKVSETESYLEEEISIKNILLNKIKDKNGNIRTYCIVGRPNSKREDSGDYDNCLEFPISNEIVLKVSR